MPENNDIETRPITGWHAARLRDPADFDPDTYKTTHGGKLFNRIDVPSTINIIWGKLKGKTKKDDPIIPQTLRFNADKWTASKAKKWLKDNEVKYISFEAAKDSKNNQAEGIEIRDFTFDDMELRVDDGEQPKIIGYASKYNNFYDLGWFRERVKAGAFDDVMDNDVRCLKNHDPNLLLGRTTNGTLRLSSNTVGFRYENDIPNTTTGKDTLEEIRRGDLTGCSFSFIVAEDEWKYFDDERPPERTITKFRQLFDVGPVTFPANPDTTVAARSLDNFKAENKFEETGQENKPDPPDEQKEDPNNRGEPTFEQKFEYEQHVRKAERLQNRLNASKQADA